MELLLQFLSNTGFYLADYRHFVMLAIGSLFVYLAIAKQYEPLLLLPIGFGVLIGNIPFFKGFGLGIYEQNSVLHYLYFGVTSGLYPSIVFLGLGAMTDFSSLLARPKLMLLGAAAQTGIWATLLSAMALGFMPKEAASIAIFTRQAGASPDRSNRHSSLLIYGTDPHYSATDHAAFDYPGGADYPYVRFSRGIQKRANDFSSGRPASLLFYSSGLNSAVRTLFLW